MLASMHKAEKSMDPILGTFHDNVLFLKHNLNAQAIGSLRSEFAGLKVKIEDLIKSMNDAITNSNQFIDKSQSIIIATQFYQISGSIDGALSDRHGRLLECF